MADWNKILSRGTVDDRRAMGVGGVGGLGIVATLVVLIVSFIGNPDPGTLQDIASQLQQARVSQQSVDTSKFTGADSYETFASTVLGSNNDTWRRVFQENNLTYTDPKLILFRNATQSGCGIATSQVGPHYCPADGSIYLDETFFDELQKRYGAEGGDVAEAYVIAHEVAHHVQYQLGLMNARNAGTNADSIKIELQADCLAGVWANSLKDQNVFEQNEILEALNAASAVGDDRIQKAATGRINPETWTHGSSDQRRQWFSTGYETGEPAKCTP